jgi:hypothetical protein
MSLKTIFEKVLLLLLLLVVVVVVVVVVWMSLVTGLYFLVPLNQR